MMIDLCNKLVNNDLTRENLLGRIEIRKTSIYDLKDICNTLAKAFDLKSPAEALFQLDNSNAILSESVKLVDKETNEIYGLLMFTEYPIQKGSPIQMLEKKLSESLEDYKQINGHSFIIDERLRNCGLDKKMLYFNADFLFKNYDFIWIGVEESLRSKSYWERLGFTKVFEIPEATFYLIPLSKKMINEYL
jgi:hypothetical protein